jgi:hypothetical protein
MEIKERIINFIRANGTKRVLLFIAIPILSLILVFLLMKVFQIRSSNSAEAVIRQTESIYKFNLKADINRLECTFEQRRCYYNNLGLDRETIINNCNELNYCEEGE